MHLKTTIPMTRVGLGVNCNLKTVKKKLVLDSGLQILQNNTVGDEQLRLGNFFYGVIWKVKLNKI